MRVRTARKHEISAIFQYSHWWANCSCGHEGDYMFPTRAAALLSSCMFDFDAKEAQG